ncbi:hypothetical protein [Paenibacillus silvisoli]|uniref:hypothetical protein n=1 Tax=Paenibacillus silvisoli TaxID=3110539 RepID=UPI002803A30A|nr:hypothetical protein [Paenibacillus silvisoli]
MAIFRLDAAAFARIDCRYVEFVEWSVSNVSDDVFDVLVQAYNNGILFYETLTEMGAGARIEFPAITNSYAPFSLLIVSNDSTPNTMKVKAVLRSKGTLIATLAEKDFDRLD